MNAPIAGFMPLSLEEQIEPRVQQTKTVKDNLTVKFRHESATLGTDDAGPGSDEARIAAICTGERAALASLFQKYARLVRGIAHRVLRDSFEADDIVQEIFLSLPPKCVTFDSSKGSVRSWILQMANHAAISRRRYLTCRHFYTSLNVDDAEQAWGDSGREAASIEEAIDNQLAATNLQKLLDSLSENQRLTLKLYFFEGYSLSEIAEKLGQSRENVRHHYFRGLEKLRKQILGKQSSRPRNLAI
jgi:RNA polymerase sigma-70 factor (ECF subfamily)